VKITIPYTPDFSQPEKGFVDAKKMQLLTEQRIMEQLDQISSCPEASLLYICFHVDLPIKTVLASVVILNCIKKKFPDYQPKAMFINTLPSPALAIDIEFGNFRDIARAFS